MQEKRGISGSTLKLIAVLSMLTDHAAAVLLSRVLVANGITSVADRSPAYIKALFASAGAMVGGVYLAYLIMRFIIGRMAFPIYCFLLVEGFTYTRDKRKYALRLFVFALLSEIPFNLAFYGQLWYSTKQNVFITLLLGLLMLAGFLKLEQSKLPVFWQWCGKAAVFAAAGAAAEASCCDYGIKGIMAIAILYLMRRNKREQLISGCVAFFWEPTAMLGFIPIAFYHGKKGLSLKYVFYFFYPVHLLILYGLKIYFFS